MTDRRRTIIYLILGILILLFSIYVIGIDPLIGGIGIAVGLITLFNAYQAHKGLTPYIIRKGKEQEEKRIKEEAEQESMYTRVRRQNQEKEAKKREEAEKEDKFNL